MRTRNKVKKSYGFITRFKKHIKKNIIAYGIVGSCAGVTGGGILLHNSNVNEAQRDKVNTIDVIVEDVNDIPSGYPLAVKKEYPIKMQVRSDLGDMELYFDTNDNSFGSEDNGRKFLGDVVEKGVIQRHEDGNNGEFKNRAMFLKNEIRYGDKLTVVLYDNKDDQMMRYRTVKKLLNIEKR